ncbi:MAG: type I restriction enzyme HsdR N-terminal domain-containing protein [Xanthomonadales bacterium]|nr:type I restriction enzyme HsdR N-terminal domain-containing protein [Xanthomonadales bacterium]
MLFYRGQKLAVIEAKKRDLPVTEGLAQAKRYAERLQARFAYATNGEGIYRVDMHTGEEGAVDDYPSPEELWDATFARTRAPGASASARCPSKTRAVSGSRATTSTTPSTRRWRPSPTAATASC